MIVFMIKHVILFVFALYHVCPKVHMSLDCPFLIASSVFSMFNLTNIHICLFLWPFLTFARYYIPYINDIGYFFKYYNHTSHGPWMWGNMVYKYSYLIQCPRGILAQPSSCTITVKRLNRKNRLRLPVPDRDFNLIGGETEVSGENY